MAGPATSPTEDLFEPLPEIPLLAELPEVDFGEPVGIPPVAPPDADMLSPLVPLDQFNLSENAERQFEVIAQEGVRYAVQVEGLAPTGLGSNFARLSALKRGEGAIATPAQIASRVNSDTRMMERLLFSEGWYSSLVDSDFELTDKGRIDVRLIATPGEQYRWREITLDLIPDDRRDLAEGFGLNVGEPIIAAQVEVAEGALLRRLKDAGYAFAEIGARDVVLDSGAPTGTYLLTGDIGPLSIFGPIRIQGYRPFSEQHAQVIARFQPGQAYDASLVDDLRRALIATQQFGGVTVAPFDTGLREPDGTAVTEIRIFGNPGPRRLLTGQFGYATEEGFRAEGSWRHRGLFRPEGMFTARAVLGTEEQRLSNQLTFSNFRQRDRTLDFLLDIANLTPPAYRARTLQLGTTLGLASTPIWQKKWTWSGGFLLGASRESARASVLPIGQPEQPELKRNFLFVSLPFSLGYDGSNDLLDPTKGFRVKLEVNPEFSREGDNLETYARMFLGATGYRSFGTGFVLAARARAGTIVGAELFDIAPTRRLYAGGGGSVRGFEYQGVGALAANDRPIGGRSLIESSIEGRYRFGDFGVVAFVDAGSVNPGSMPSFDGMRFGAGVGGRYYTSFGPIRFDVARAINRSPRDPKLAIYISIGQSF